jgi:hypothetical protein
VLDLSAILKSLSETRPVFHSEADFQFALAWEIKLHLPTAEIRLEYPPPNDPARAVDIIVRNDSFLYPIELKYKAKRLSTTIDEETFNLKEHGAQDLGRYDFVKDIRKVESLASNLDGFKVGYVIWLTNDPSYWKPPLNPSVGYADFSVHDGAIKTGAMKWAEHLGVGTIKSREQPLVLNNAYEIQWHTYSNLDTPNGLFKYVLLKVL